MTTLSPTDLKTLDQTRQRLAQLTSALASLQSSILKSDPLPPPAPLHALSSILSSSLTAYTTHLSASPALTTMAAFPLPSYPARAPETEGLLQRLLRKKLEVGAEEWVERGRERGRGVFGGLGVGGEGSGDGEGGMGLIGEEGLWAWAGMEANRVARGYRWGGVGEEEEEGDDEDEDEDMEGGGGGEERDGGATTGGERGGEMLPVGDVLRFLSTGKEATRKV